MLQAPSSLISNTSGVGLPHLQTACPGVAPPIGKRVLLMSNLNLPFFSSKRLPLVVAGSSACRVSHALSVLPGALSSRFPQRYLPCWTFLIAKCARSFAVPAGRLSKADKELIIVATSVVNRCPYCVVAHGALHRIYSKQPTLADQVSGVTTAGTPSFTWSLVLSQNRGFTRCAYK